MRNTTTETVEEETALAVLEQRVVTCAAAVKTAEERMASMPARQQATAAELSALQEAQAKIEATLAEHPDDEDASENLKRTLAASAMQRARLAGLALMQDSAKAQLDAAKADLASARQAVAEEEARLERAQLLGALRQARLDVEADVERSIELTIEASRLLGRLVLRQHRAIQIHQDAGQDAELADAAYAVEAAFIDKVNGRFQRFMRRAGELGLRRISGSQWSGVDLEAGPLVEWSEGSFLTTIPNVNRVVSREVVGF